MERASLATHGYRHAKHAHARRELKAKPMLGELLDTTEKNR